MPCPINNFCGLALALNSTGKVINAKRQDDPKRNNADPGQGRKRQYHSCNEEPGSSLRRHLYYWHDVRSSLQREVVRRILQCMAGLMSSDSSGRYSRSKVYALAEPVPFLDSCLIPCEGRTLCPSPAHQHRCPTHIGLPPGGRSEFAKPV